MANTPVAKEAAASNIVTDIIFTLITCGIYGLFWQARTFRTLNAFLGQEKYSFWKWFLLSIVTCGIWAIYTAYLEGQDVAAIQGQLGKPVNGNAPVLYLLLTLFSLHIVAMALVQSEINGWVE